MVQKEFWRWMGEEFAAFSRLRFWRRSRNCCEKRREVEKSSCLPTISTFFAGTSTGGIIAACLSWGMTVDRIRNFYLENGKEMFDKASILKRHRYKFEDERLSKRLQKEFETDTTLGSEKLK